MKPNLTYECETYFIQDNSNGAEWSTHVVEAADIQKKK